MNAGLSAIEYRVARDRIAVGANIDAIVGRRAKDFVAGNGNAIPKVRAISIIGFQGNGNLAVADYVAGNRNSAILRGVIEQNISGGRHRWIPIYIVDHRIEGYFAEGSKTKLDAVLSGPRIRNYAASLNITPGDGQLRVGIISRDSVLVVIVN